MTRSHAAAVRGRMVQNPIEKDGFNCLERVNNRTKGALLFAPTIATGEGERA
jgi:hypothetical protein